MKSITLSIPGFSIAGTIWGNSNKPAILALHGWLDNSNSFYTLAPFFSNDYYFIAVDLPGHGHSSHLPKGCNYHFIDGIFTVIELLKALEIDKIHLLGHSMGACLASLVAGIIPDRILSLSLIEGIGPFSSPEETACFQLKEYANFLNKKSKQPKGYSHFERASLARALKGYVSLDIAKILCQRSLIENNGKYYWRHDPRLLIHSPLRMTEMQILSCLKNISAKTCLLLSSNGFSFNAELLKDRIQAVKNIEIHHLEGGHHIHMEKPEEISQLLAHFITYGEKSS